MKVQKSINIIRIDKINDGQINIFPSVFKDMSFEYVYRTATGVRWSNEINCFYKNEANRWDDEIFILNTIDSVYSEYGMFLTIDENTEINNIPKESINKLIVQYFYSYVFGKDNYQFVYVNNDGSIRELSISERIYLQTKYHGAEGDRPYIKSRYEQTTPDNKLNGYCFRNKIPKEIEISKVKISGSCIDLYGEIESVKRMGYEIDFNGMEFLKLVISA